jgi:hypothetical protein
MKSEHHSSSVVRAASKLSIAFVMVITGCIDPYPPPVSNAQVNYLVVDGFLNSSNGVARVKLSRAVPLDGPGHYPTESGAVVQVEKDDGAMFSLPEIAAGKYEVIRPDLAIGSKYRLSIMTNDGKTFQSDFVTLKQSPELGAIELGQDGNNITVLVNARDDNRSTRYYQWLYTETWEYDSDAFSAYYVKNGTASPRLQPGEFIDICYSSSESSKVLIATTEDQSGDVINDFPLVSIPIGSKKLSRRYRITVQQRALDETSYSYWLQLQKTTEQLGGLFDPLPSRLTGNLRGISDSKAVVLGYFNGGGVQEKTAYFRPIDLPVEARIVNRHFCPIDSVELKDLDDLSDGTPLLLPYPFTIVQGYTISSLTCSDCRAEGGVTTKPVGWPL